MKTNKFNYLIYLFIVVSLVSLDQYTKSIILNYFELYQSKTIIDGFFSLTYVQNFGAGFSIMQNARTTFLIITPICLVGFTYLFIKSNDKLSKTALLLMISGTIGNFIDRIVRIYVVDFLDFIIFGWDFPIFNVADIFLTIGVCLYIIALIKEEKDAKIKLNS
ncbi:MAG: signal peptidase II [Solobacterium sp.]|nr:signal peptidase II [Solobacterium sp.]MCI6878897.1 signal peptidase II [Solobacterium sp.]MDD7775681.1 signal peptidase II [Solobacterium sp.]MDY2952932.1 signal peptidase II [Erysipelotrichaceae bacterium]MDY5277298.1 signal peptidase II [Erysipelotrichaceae bacterium]